MSIFEELESEVRSYSRAWPAVFHSARGTRLFTESGRPYLDFFAGAGALNYGHNEPVLKQALLDYIAADGVTHTLDMFTAARREFLEAFQERILGPGGLDYRIAFPGPGGTNAVEAAMKLARTVTGRPLILGFGHAFHGMTLGALSVTASARKRAAAGVPLTNTLSVPYGQDDGRSELEHLDRSLSDPGSGMDRPAAVIVETIQGEGGINVAGSGWLRGLQDLCRRHGVLLILDDVQMGCGRTGEFFSFTEIGVVPDMICLSKSISGYGLPLALTLIRPDLDIWKPGDHNGTFRGVAPAFVTGARALHSYWSDNALVTSTRAKGERVRVALERTAAAVGGARPQVRGRGLVWGLDLTDAGGPDAATRVCAEAFENGLLMETCGARDEVVKLLLPLTVSDDELSEGLEIIDHCVRIAITRERTTEELVS